MGILKTLPAVFLLLLLGFPSILDAQSPSSGPLSGSSSPSPSSTPSRGTIRLIAIRRNGQPVTDLRPEDLSIRLNGQDRKVLSVSFTASLPKTIGIYLDGSFYRGYDELVGKEMGTVLRILKSVWREHDLVYVVSFSDKIYEDVPPTDDLAQIEKSFPKILSRDFDRPPGWDAHWVYRWPNVPYGNMSLRDALSSASVSLPQNEGREKIYIIVSGEGAVGFMTDNAAKKAILDQKARFFALMPDEGLEGGSACLYNDTENSGPCYLGLWRADRAARSIGEITGGDVFTVERKRDLVRAQTRLVNELRSTYVVSYEPLAQGASSGKVEVRCKLSGVRLLFSRE